MTATPNPVPAEDASATCPSGLCAAGNLLIGIVQGNGVVAPVTPALEVDDSFVQRAIGSSVHPPEARFRFAGHCVTTSCEQWTGTRCAVGDKAVRLQPSRQALAPCSIRATCRWWKQNGSAACAACSLMVHTRVL